MRKTIPLYLIAASLVSSPLAATADNCSPGKKHMKYGYYDRHGYYDRPHRYRPHHPMHSRMHRPDHSKPYWYGGHPDRSAKAPAQKNAGKAAEGTADIVATATNAGSFTTLVEALKATGLAETLKGPGPYTVFAPSDDAFNRLPETIRTAITSDKAALTDLLSYHVLAGEVTARDVARLRSAETVQGSALSIDASDGVTLDGANLITADIRATNGIIHVIDAVMIPN